MLWRSDCSAESGALAEADGSGAGDGAGAGLADGAACADESAVGAAFGAGSAGDGASACGDGGVSRGDGRDAGVSIPGTPTGAALGPGSTCVSASRRFEGGTRAGFIDNDIVESIRDFVDSATHRTITVELKRSPTSNNPIFKTESASVNYSEAAPVALKEG